MIEVRSLTKSFSGKTAIEGIDLNIQDDCILGLVGHNGAGKTTLMRAMVGIYRPEEGEVLVDSEPVWENEAKKQDIFFMGEEQFLLPGATMADMAAFYRGFFPKFSMEAFYKLAGLFGLNPKERVKKYSKGMRRQAELIMALSSHAKYLLLDEVFDGLDPAMRDLVRKLLKEGIATSALTVVISSHNLLELENLCDQIALINHHRVRYFGALEQLYTLGCHVKAIFSQEADAQWFDGMPLTDLEIHKKVVTAVYEGAGDDAQAAFASLDPLSLEIQPLTLEEIFLRQMEVKGYDFQGIF